MEPSVFVPTGNRLGESALWHGASQRLIWLDLFDRKLHSCDAEAGTIRVLELSLAAPLGAAVETDDPHSLLITHPGGLARLSLSDGKVSPFLAPENGRDSVSYNDCKVDRYGRLWLGTSDLPEIEPRGALWCVEPSGAATLGDAGFIVSNGPAFSPDGRTLYFNDTFGRKTYAYDINADDPHPRNRRALVSYGEEEGFPDGLTVDAFGCLWVAHWAGSRVTRFSPRGDRLDTVRVPCVNATSVCFGGENLETLFITTASEGDTSPGAGHVFALRPGTRGLPEPLFELRSGPLRAVYRQ